MKNWMMIITDCTQSLMMNTCRMRMEELKHKINRLK